MATPGTRSIRSILVHVDGTSGCADRLALARRLGRETRAEVWAMFVGALADRPLALAISESPAALLETVDWAAASHARTLFDEAAAVDASLHWLDSLGLDAEKAFHRQALLADLLVLGQPDPGAEPGTAPPQGFVEWLLVDTGQPVLLLPRARSADTLGRQVLIGWNGTPPAAHAVAAALPWLKAARQVHVLQGGPAYEAEVGELDIERYLDCHGVDIELHTDPMVDASDAGSALLTLARDVSADLLVMGAFGHGRTRERLLGGTTRTILQTMTLPVLMAH
jgi:nucleotide-binding universal stress UspA family protein